MNGTEPEDPMSTLSNASDTGEGADDPAAAAFDAMGVKLALQGATLVKLTALVEALSQNQTAATETLTRLTASPTLQLTPIKFAHDLATVRGTAAREGRAAAEEIARADRAGDDARSQALVATRVTAELASWQKWWLIAPFVAGVCVTGLGAIALRPDTSIAAHVARNGNGWQVGSQLMADADPVTWNKFVAAWNEIKRQDAAVDACKESRAAFGFNQAACEVSVPKTGKPK